MGSKIPPATISPIETPIFRDALAVWAKIGVLSFGGPAGQIALMHRILVEERRWIAEDRFLHALNFCMLLPGTRGYAACDLCRLAAARHLGRALPRAFSSCCPARSSCSL